MIKKFATAFFTVLGGMIGYEAFRLFRYLFELTEYSESNPLTGTGALWIGVCFVLIFGVIFYRIAPSFTRQSRKIASDISDNIESISPMSLIGGALGVIFGLVIAYLISRLYSNVITEPSLYLTISIIIYAALAFVGAVVGSRKSVEFMTPILNMRKAMMAAQVRNSMVEEYGYNAKEKKTQRIPKILDTSVIIDGRILEIMKTGFFEGPVVIPEFVLVELRHIADSSDSLKRSKGRRGLDILNKIQTEYGIEVYNTDSEKALKDIPEVDVKLLKLAQIMKGKVVTNDFNLNKVAAIKDVPVLNINELANAVKPLVIPGEKMTVTLIKQGKDPNQGIAYLDDGTMIVVEDGRKKVGETVSITVTSVLQTAAGRMIFGRIKV